MFKNLLNTFNELNDIERLKDTVTASLDEIKNTVSLDDVIKYAGMAANSPVLHVLSPQAVRNIQIAKVVVERAAAVYSVYQETQGQQPLDYSLEDPQESQPIIDYAFIPDQEVVSQQNEQAFREQERVDYDNLQYDQQLNDISYNQIQDDFVYQELQMDYSSGY